MTESKKSGCGEMVTFAWLIITFLWVFGVFSAPWWLIMTPWFIVGLGVILYFLVFLVALIIEVIRNN